MLIVILISCCSPFQKELNSLQNKHATAQSAFNAELQAELGNKERMFHDLETSLAHMSTTLGEREQEKRADVKLIEELKVSHLWRLFLWCGGINLGGGHT